jgi:cytochrome P450
MQSAQDRSIYWDPYDPALVADPFPVFKRLREEAPLYYNAKYDFYVLSRFEDVTKGLFDRDTFSSAKGGVIEFIKSGVVPPRGVFIFEDPPLHTIHRGLLTRVFTPKRMNDLEPAIRKYCAEALDPIVGAGRFDFVRDLGAHMPMQVIGMLLGIPEADRQAVRERADAALRTEIGKPQEYGADHNFAGEGFEEYIDWRLKHPSDDLMTQLVQAEFRDETGATRRLGREALLIFINILSSAGNETTNRLIGWTGKLLGDHPDQRRQIHADRSLLQQTIEEVLRFEPPPLHIARYVTRDFEIHGQTVPKGSTIVFLTGSANRDHRQFEDGDAFNIHREKRPHLAFGNGYHVCLGQALARVEGRVALDEVLNRFPEWEVDLDNAYISPTSTVRGWQTLPTYTDGTKPKRTLKRYNIGAPEQAVLPAAPTGHAAGDGDHWNVTLQTPMGPQQMTALLKVNGGALTGSIQSAMGGGDISGTASGDALEWTMKVTKPMPLELQFKVKVAGNAMSGDVKLGAFGTANLTGARA